MQHAHSEAFCKLEYIIYYLLTESLSNLTFELTTVWITTVWSPMQWTVEARHMRHMTHMSPDLQVDPSY